MKVLILFQYYYQAGMKVLNISTQLVRDKGHTGYTPVMSHDPLACS
jgi:hypothetical protein